MMAEPTHEQWQALYAAAREFSQLAPWAWMTDADLFAVENPATGEVGYGIVMGGGGQEFGLAVFLGTAGFAAYYQLMSGAVIPESLDATAHLRSISVSFEDRETLEQRDRDVIRSLGLRFRGRRAWPWFRSQRPGYLPWFLDAEEAGFLEAALRQAVEVSQRVKAGALKLTSGVDDRPILTRCFREGSWVDAWRPPPPREVPQEEPEPVDEVRVQRLRAAKPQSRDFWQLDFFLLPAPVGERGERPYLPLMLMAVTRQGFVVAAQIMEPWASATARQEAVLALLEQGPDLPRELQVGKEEVKRVLAPLARGLGITVRETRLGVLEAVKDELLGQLM